MMAGTGVAVGAMAAIVCHKCGIEYHVPSWWKQKRRANGTEFWCPNGHGAVFVGPSPEVLARQEAQRERDRADWAAQQLESARREVVSANHRLRAARGQQTKLKKRIAAGCCPCCQRTFQNLARHMAGQHPEYVGGDDA